MLEKIRSRWNKARFVFFIMWIFFSILFSIIYFTGSMEGGLFLSILIEIIFAIFPALVISLITLIVVKDEKNEVTHNERINESSKPVE